MTRQPIGSLQSLSETPARPGGPDRPPTPTSERQAGRTPRRWTLHGLNNGSIFRATRRGVSVLPRRVSYGVGDAGTWLAWRLMRSTRRAIADNLRPLFPNESQRQREYRALQTLRAYARDVIDFLRALDVPAREAGQLFSHHPDDGRRMNALLAQGKGVILITGHFGNWEIGSVFLRRLFKLPLTIVAMAEADEDVNRIRREIRDSLDVATIEVGRAFDTALQIRKRLSENHMVAMLVDRHVGPDRVEVSLFGRRAWFLRSPALMAYLTGAPIVPCFITRLAPARFQVEMGVPIPVPAETPRDIAVQQVAQGFADQLAARIQAAPQYWYHFYPYWQAQETNEQTNA
jgi:KDO2-lipid IV(A) lauroyltransferase